MQSRKTRQGGWQSTAAQVKEDLDRAAAFAVIALRTGSNVHRIQALLLIEEARQLIGAEVAEEFAEV